MYGEQALKASLEGKTVISVEHNSDTVKFETDAGPVEWYVTADCCSYTWIEHADLELVKGKVFEVKELGLPKSWYAAHPGAPEEDSLQLYGIEIRTAGGVGTIDFRNESNGYYGGSMEVRP